MSVFYCQFLITLTYIHNVEKPWSIEIVLLSYETETEVVPQSDRVYSNQELVFSAVQREAEVTQQPADD